MGVQTVDPAFIRWVGEALQHEPATWGCNVQPTATGGWTATPDRFLRRYDGVADVGDCLDRLLEQLQPTIGGLGGDAVAAEAQDSQSQEFDYFISHASEDKNEIARPLFVELKNRGHRVWFDEAELVVGQSLVESIDRGLGTCTHGIVFLSPSFFAKRWPQRELAGLVQRAMSGEAQVVLPVWHGVSGEDIRVHSAPLADIIAVDSKLGTKLVADALERAARTS